jgi:hypothetical protein
VDLPEPDGPHQGDKIALLDRQSHAAEGVDRDGIEIINLHEIVNANNAGHTESSCKMHTQQEL